MAARRGFLPALLVFVGAIAAPGIAAAQTSKFPDRMIRLIVPFAPGGGVDVFARLLTDKLKQQHGYTLIIENRAGGNGSVGGNVVRRSDPDGYTLLISAATHVMAQHVMKNAPYDPITDFTPLARIGAAPMLLVMATNRSPKTISELVKAAKAQPESWVFAAASLGAPGHLATLAFNNLAKLNLRVVSYRGTAPALTDVAGGHVQLMIDPVLALLPMAREKKVIGLAVTTATRTKLAPEYPTAAESGLPGLEYASWYGVWGPKPMPADLVTKLNGIFNGAVTGLDKEGRLAKLGIDAVTETPAQFDDYQKAYVAKNGALLKAVNFEPR